MGNFKKSVMFLKAIGTIFWGLFFSACSSNSSIPSPSNPLPPSPENPQSPESDTVFFDDVQVYSLPNLTNPISLTAADFNSDGFIDIVVTSLVPEQKLYIFYGNGLGALNPTPAPLSIQGQYSFVESGDFNGDNKPDLVTIGYAANGILLSLGKGNGEFEQGAFYPLQGHGKRMHLVDFNMDGKLDVLASTSGSGQPGTLHVLFGDGNGNLTLSGTYTTNAANGETISTCDLNNDQFLDVVFETSSAADTLLFKAISPGILDPNPVSLGAISETKDFGSVAGIHCTDMNGDGRSDIVSTSHLCPNQTCNLDEILVFFARPDGFFDFPTHLKSPSPIIDFKLGDINQDGKIDIIAVHSNFDQKSDLLSYWINKGNSDFENPISIPSGGSTPLGLSVMDLNNDSFLDLAVVNFDSHNVSVFLNRGKHN